ncbi:uncharacterized protein BO97DRAFT_413705 [Aspergillus homomorphus CBS 101889]|uniref:C2H2-type domain-containing protein n=1 Tax=Aspergillus homomorphus (strain CBS 101889) TaxID=1450537 RepID=A0A395I0Q7_ASPHC|nr:hypothetical protein BO97DRAFT_413705 [Aspergillus homomorphus CBS 101889]RAL13259.1 hypothetical protein BO97DRAFT_413705 [Aspergillus homomorphus CBS 101889]
MPYSALVSFYYGERVKWMAVGIELPLGRPNNATLIDQVRRCRKLKISMPTAKGYWGEELQPLSLRPTVCELAKDFDTDYAASVISKFRIKPDIVLGISKLLYKLEKWLKQAKDTAESSSLRRILLWHPSWGRCRRETQALMNDLTNRLEFAERQVQSVSSSDDDKSNTYTSLNEQVNVYLPGVQKKYPLAMSASLLRRIALRQYACRWFLCARHGENQLAHHTRKLGFPQPAPAFTTTILPPPPTVPPGATDFICPCSDTLPKKMYHPVPWRKHVLHDFHPYICMHADCGKAFGDADVWEQHMLQHGNYWACYQPGCHDITIPLHRSYKTDEHCHLIHGLDERPPDSRHRQPSSKLEFKKCPLCQASFSDSRSTEIKWHIAAHLEREIMCMRA